MTKSDLSTLGRYLASIRTDRTLTLRQVQQMTRNEVSNAYLSQIERDQVPKPSAHVLRALAEAYGIDSIKLLERAGYVSPGETLSRRGSATALSGQKLSANEEEAILKFLKRYRSRIKYKK